MNAQLDALLAVQRDDDVIQGIEARIASLAPRLARLDAERQTAARAVASAEAAVEREAERHVHLTARAQDFRRLHERAVSQAEQGHRAAQAMTAASAQLDIARRALGDAESEQNASAGRLTTVRQAHAAALERLEAVDRAQEGERASVEADRDALAGELAGARTHRAASAGEVEPRLLLRYERVRARRRSQAVYPVRNFSCGSCDTAVATQRRAALLGGSIDVCESCGVLLYAPPAAVAAPALG